MNRLPILVGAAVAMLVLMLGGHQWFGVAVGCVGIFLAFRAGPRQRAFTVDQRRELRALDSPLCAYCGRLTHYASDCPFGGCGLDYEADHVEAFSTGGATTVANGVVACRRCNRWKSDRPVEEFLVDPDGDGVSGVSLP